MLPPAPGRFSTNTGCLNKFDSGSAIVLAIVSVVPPADAPTRSLIGREGYSAALNGPSRMSCAETPMRAVSLAARIQGSPCLLSLIDLSEAAFKLAILDRAGIARKARGVACI